MRSWKVPLGADFVYLAVEALVEHRGAVLVEEWWVAIFSMGQALGSLVELLAPGIVILVSSLVTVNF